ncbi:hypothetical protein SE92_04250 [Bradyrhizobium sp. AT1]|nr:hypothetical protein SE92_04250 [Bradyrhizobium sp. AT1]
MKPADDATLAVYSALKDELSDLEMSLAATNVDRRITGAVSEFRNILGSNFQELNIVQLALKGRFLKALHESYKDELPNYHVAQLSHVVSLSEMIAQSRDEWRTFCLEAEAISVSKEDAAAVKVQTRAIAGLLGELADHVSTQVPAALTDASGMIEPDAGDRDKPVLYALRSIENLVIALASNMQLQTLQAATEKNARHWIAEAALRLMKAPVLELVRHFSNVLGWIPRIMSKLF